MPDAIIDSIVTGKLDTQLVVRWLNNESLEDVPEDCALLCNSRSEFVACFLSYLRIQTDSILQTNNSALQIRQRTPDKVLNSRRKHRRSISDPTSDDRTDSLSVKPDRRSHESPSKDRRRGRKVKTKLFNEDRKEASVSSDESRLSLGMERMVVSSTPMKNGLRLSESPVTTASPVTPQRFTYDRCDTPRLAHRKDKSVSLGDFITSAQKTKKRKSRNASEENESKVDLDISNTEVFPEISRKASSLRSEKRRIKPTNLDGSMSQKSFSLNSFNSECFQQPSPLALEENNVFKNQKLQPKELANSFEAERNILKLERQKLMEKFNLNASSTTSIPVTPQIKIIKKDCIERTPSYVNAESSKVVFKDKLDLLIELYDVLLKNNLILSVNSEIYFLISILLSKQIEEDYLEIETKLTEKNLTNYLLKSIHNSTYFAIKSLWNLRSILEVILDKNSLKILGENKKVRSYSADLAKFLLNCYGLKCEAESQEKPRSVDKRTSNGIVCFNLETDNAENFPSLLSFQNFKKQRDMFYEILRWYTESAAAGVPRSTLRARVKTLVGAGHACANHHHLAALLVAHMLAECLHTEQESKLSKLQRRLTCPAGDSRLPHFTEKETFYKDVLVNAGSESFRAHVRDALASELIALDSTPLQNANSSDISREYLQLQRKLGLLAKFLGFLASLPYVTLPADCKSVSQPCEPRERVLQASLQARSYSQPALDLQGLLSAAIAAGRTTITVPWLAHYLSTLDHVSCRLPYYRRLLAAVAKIFMNALMTNRTIGRFFFTHFIRFVSGWLFDLPHLPPAVYDAPPAAPPAPAVYNAPPAAPPTPADGVDSLDLITDAMLFELCPYLREVNVLLSTCKVDRKETYRHITPVSLSVNSEDRVRSKEKELQMRLEEELIKSQPSSTRRVLELTIERVTAACVRDLTASVNAARAMARDGARKAVAERGDDLQALLKTLQAIYTSHLTQLRESAQNIDTLSRVSGALTSLLPLAPKALQHAAARASKAAVLRWARDHWTSTAVLCKDIEAEMHNLITLGDAVKPEPKTEPKPSEALDNFTSAVSVASAIIHLKEQVCLLLDYEEPTGLSGALATCSRACSRACSPNNMFGRGARAILQLSVDACVVYVSRKPRDVTESFLNQLHAVWSVCCPDRNNEPQEPDLPERRDLSPELRNFEDDRAPTPITSDEEDAPITKTNRNVKNLIIAPNTNSISIKIPSPTLSPISPMSLKSPLSPNLKSPTSPNVKSPNSLKSPKCPNVRSPRALSPKPKANSSVKSINNSSILSVVDTEYTEVLEFFDRILCPRNIVLLNTSKCKSGEVWEALATVLVFLLKFDYLSEDSLTEQCLAVYRQDWPQSVLESLSTCLKSVSSRWTRSSGKFTLFLDFLAEFCGDLDLEPIE
ncbi:codanin-1 [Cydia amplana]|uniref:codanin-1 n=1 Tax=Cydia amplana TaxID=1869771 RepID=UPI002FE5ACF8